MKLSTSSLQREGEHGQLVAARQELERPELRDLGREARRHLARVALDSPVAVEAEAEEVVVLRDDLGAGPREVQREGRHVVAEVVDPEDQVLGQRLRVAPDDPADARVDEPVLVARRVDRGHPRRAGSPSRGRGRGTARSSRRTRRRRGPECRCPVSSWNVSSALADLRRPARTSRRRSSRGCATTPIVFSSQSFDRLLGREVEAVALHRHETHLDVPVVGELLPADLDVDPHHEVRLVGRLARRPRAASASAA